jgi:polysaccharide biosynthesis protein PslH
MKILFITNVFPFPTNFGSSMRTFNLLRFMASKGKVTLVSQSETEKDKIYLDHANQYCEKVYLADRKLDNYHATSGGKFKLKDRLSEFLKMESWEIQDFYSKETARLIEASDPSSFDLIFFRYSVLAQHFLKNPKYKSLWGKTIVDVDDVTIKLKDRELKKEKLSYKKMRSLLDLYFLRVYWKKLKGFYGLFSASEEDGAYLLRNQMAKRVFVIPNTYQVNANIQELPSENFEILFCGSLDYAPNVEGAKFFCAQILPLIKKEIPDSRLTIIGKNPVNEVKALSGIPGVIVEGNVPSVEPYYKNAALIVVPLLNGAGTRIKILEAMAFKRPVVSTTIGAEGIDAQNGQDILIGDTPELFAKNCILILRDKDIRESVAEAGYELIKEKYSQGVFDQKMEEFTTAYKNRLEGNRDESILNTETASVRSQS